MKQIRQFLILSAGVIGVAAALIAAPTAIADPQLPSCEDNGGSSIDGGQTTECASPGNIQIEATPPQFAGEGEEFYGFPFF